MTSRSIQWMAGAAAVLVAGFANAATAPAGKATTSCNRACLVRILDKWFDALAAHMPDISGHREVVGTRASSDQQA